MLSIDPQYVVDRLVEFQRAVRDLIVRSRRQAGLHQVDRSAAADTIYKIDAAVEPVLVEFCRDWSKQTPLVLVAEGLLDDDGREVDQLVFPAGTRDEDAPLRLLVDPIDGTRGIMYDKRSAWALAAAAPNRGPGARTRLRDAQVSVMTELPTGKMGFADVLWAVRGGGAAGNRVDLSSGDQRPLALAPSAAPTIDHGFASVSNFFPGTKVLAAELMEFIAAELVGPSDVSRSVVFDDQYICTGGQFYELIVGHDRFNADLRPAFYRIQSQPAAAGLCCHPYDCAGLLVAEEAGVIVTDETGAPLDGPMDVTTGLAWAGYANVALRAAIEPLVQQFLRRKGT